MISHFNIIVPSHQHVQIFVYFIFIQKSAMGSPLPLLYVENQPTDAIENDTLYPTEKRSGRYYRRYPWKRQNNKYRA